MGLLQTDKVFFISMLEMSVGWYTLFTRIFKLINIFRSFGMYYWVFFCCCLIFDAEFWLPQFMTILRSNIFSHKFPLFWIAVGDTNTKGHMVHRQLWECWWAAIWTVETWRISCLQCERNDYFNIETDRIWKISWTAELSEWLYDDFCDAFVERVELRSLPLLRWGPNGFEIRRGYW